MRIARLAVLCLVALAVTGTVQARSVAPPAGPAGLKAFLLRADEAAKHEFSRTPSFAWLPVRGAIRYEFELATSKQFQGTAIIWTNVGKDQDEAPATSGSSTSGSTPAPTDPATPSPTDNLRSPAISVDLALPWITGSPYALYAHVRAVTAAGPTPWSKPFGFNVRWFHTTLTH